MLTIGQRMTFTPSDADLTSRDDQGVTVDLDDYVDEPVAVVTDLTADELGGVASGSPPWTLVKVRATDGRSFAAWYDELSEAGS